MGIWHVDCLGILDSQLRQDTGSDEFNFLEGSITFPFSQRLQLQAYVVGQISASLVNAILYELGRTDGR